MDLRQIVETYGYLAVFVGAFLVFSVVSLSVAQRTPGFALLGVLGMTATQRRMLVLIESVTIAAISTTASPIATTSKRAARSASAPAIRRKSDTIARADHRSRRAAIGFGKSFLSSSAAPSGTAVLRAPTVTTR